MRPRDLELDLTKMIPFEMPVSNRNPRMFLKVSEKDIVNMNSLLLKSVKEMYANMEMSFLHTEDYMVLALGKVTSGSVFKFHSDGSIKYPEFASELKAKGYQLPARYVVEWNENVAAWVGILEEVPMLENPKSVVAEVARKVSAKGKSKKNVGV